MNSALPLLLLTTLAGFTSCAPHDKCGKFRKMYIDIGDRGYVSPANFTLYSCGIELVTCPSCVISITVIQMNLATCGPDSSCRCHYLHFREPPYETSTKEVCGESDRGTQLYNTLTRYLDISLVFRDGPIIPKDAFLIEYSAERNRRVVRGLPAPAANSTGRIMSPFFPALYPKDMSSEVVILSNDPASRVQLLFDDFQISPWSIMEFYDWNGARLEATSGGTFRPPAILSTGPALLVRFFANGGTGPGFKAQYTYLPSTVDESEAKPITDCGGFVDDTGGAITMMHMVDTGIRTYDCIWLIRPPRTLHSKTHLYLKVAKFSDMARKAVVEIRQGMTSDSLLLESVRYTTPTLHLLPLAPRQRELVVGATTGFYVRLKASFDSNSRLAIVYTGFSFLECFSGSDFLCHNHRCVPAEVRCDGFDHCGDESDEPSSCADSVTTSSLEPRWYSHTPNYYFPRTARYPDLRTAATVFIATTLGLLVLIAALIVLMYRMGARARRQRDLQDRLRTISGILDNLSADSVRIEEVLEVDEPPDYEAPPEYEEVVKALFERTGIPSSRRREGRHARRKQPREHGNLERASRFLSPSPGLPPAPVPSPIPDSPPPAYSMSLEITPSLQSLRGSLSSFLPNNSPGNTNIPNLTISENIQVPPTSLNESNNSSSIPVVSGFNVNNIIRNLFTISNADENESNRAVNPSVPHEGTQPISANIIPSITTTCPSNSDINTIDVESTNIEVPITNSLPVTAAPNIVSDISSLSLSIPFTNSEQSAEVVSTVNEIISAPILPEASNAELRRSDTSESDSSVSQARETTSDSTNGAAQQSTTHDKKFRKDSEEIRGSTSTLNTSSEDESPRGHRRIGSHDSRGTEHWLLDDGDFSPPTCGCDGACPCARLASISRDSSMAEEDLNVSQDNLSEMSKSRESLNEDKQQDRPPLVKGRSVPSLRDLRSRSLDIFFSLPGDEGDVNHREQQRIPMPVLIEEETRPLLTPTEETKPFVARNQEGRVLVHETCNRIEQLLRQTSQDSSEIVAFKLTPTLVDTNNPSFSAPSSTSCNASIAEQPPTEQQTSNTPHAPAEETLPQKKNLTLHFPPLPPRSTPSVTTIISNLNNSQIPNSQVSKLPAEIPGPGDTTQEPKPVETHTEPTNILRENLPMSSTHNLPRPSVSLNVNQTKSSNTLAAPLDPNDSSLKPSHSLENGRLLTDPKPPKESSHRRCQSVTIPCLGVRGVVPYRRL